MPYITIHGGNIKLYLKLVKKFYSLIAKKTIYKMMLASIVTQDNINEVQENPIDFINKVSEAVAQSKK